MAFDDPVVWVLIIIAIVVLFGGSMIPKLARGLGQARNEYKKGLQSEYADQSVASDDPLIAAARKEGIDTTGKSRDQIASELAWKLNKK